MIRDLLIVCAFIVVSTVVLDSNVAGKDDAGEGHSKHGREFKATQVEKEIVRLEHAMVEFQTLVAEADSLNMPAERKRYGKLHNQLVAAMQRAAARANAHAIVVGRDHMTLDGPYDSMTAVSTALTKPQKRNGHAQSNVDTPTQTDPTDRETPDHRDLREAPVVPEDIADRVTRMRELVRQSKALQHLTHRGDATAVLQNRAVMLEFASLMRADLVASKRFVGGKLETDPLGDEQRTPGDEKLDVTEDPGAAQSE